MAGRVKRLWLLVPVFSLFVTPTTMKPRAYPLEGSADAIKILVVSHGWHSGLVLPTDKIKGPLTEVLSYFNQSHYIEFGWGDSGFYQTENYTAALVANALFRPSESVMHVAAVPIAPERYFSASDKVWLTISGLAMSKLEQAIFASFAKSTNQRLLRLGTGLYGESLFFRGQGSYHGFNTCNSWTARMLKTAEAPLARGLYLSSPAVMSEVRNVVQPMKTPLGHHYHQ